MSTTQQSLFDSNAKRAYLITFMFADKTQGQAVITNDAITWPILTDRTCTVSTDLHSDARVFSRLILNS